jgi:hypothetical protein
MEMESAFKVKNVSVASNERKNPYLGISTKKGLDQT